MTDIQYGIKIMGGREVSRPYRFFSPKASGFYPFGDATDLAGEVGGIAKRLFFMFLFQSPSIFPLNQLSPTTISFRVEAK